ncbi:MAG: 50S ribosomal protein L13 [Dehalococcoidales bacterium]|nr:50S ribosomal protein L13 [Dehalococcoidales bacterium]
MIKTYSTKASDIKREWHVVDAADKVLGRLSTQVAALLMGKHKPLFNRNMDVGDYVVVINAERIRVTGNKAKQKEYHTHSGYPGGFKTTTLENVLATHPERIIEHAVKGMLPKNRLEDRMMVRLKVIVGETHPYGGQLKKVAVTKAEAPEKIETAEKTE